jgi:hypothetical protein
MTTSSTNVEIPQAVPEFENITIVVLNFTRSSKPGSSFIGHASVEIHGLVPGHVIGLARVSYFAPFDAQDPDEKGKCRFSNFKNQEDKWEASTWFRRETSADEEPDRTLNYRLLARIRKAVEQFLATQENPTASFDELPPDIPVNDEDNIPF